jgi:hypothetical protein
MFWTTDTMRINYHKTELIPINMNLEKILPQLHKKCHKYGWLYVSIYVHIYDKFYRMDELHPFIEIMYGGWSSF